MRFETWKVRSPYGADSSSKKISKEQDTELDENSTEAAENLRVRTGLM
jgi:hypothetical protein